MSGFKEFVAERNHPCESCSTRQANIRVAKKEMASDFGEPVNVPLASRPLKMQGLTMNLGLKTMYKVNLGFVPEALGLVSILDNHRRLRNGYIHLLNLNISHDISTQGQMPAEPRTGSPDVDVVSGPRSN